MLLIDVEQKVHQAVNMALERSYRPATMFESAIQFIRGDRCWWVKRISCPADEFRSACKELGVLGRYISE
jgi:hypothetical protein